MVAHIDAREIRIHIFKTLHFDFDAAHPKDNFYPWDSSIEMDQFAISIEKREKKNIDTDKNRVYTNKGINTYES
jgi:hypothetical protein